MSDTKVSDQTDVISDESKETPDVKETVAYSTYSKVLGEKKKVQAQFQELQSKLDQAEQSKLEQEGKKDELITQLKNQAESEKKQRLDMQKSAAMKVINMQVQAAAKEAGCLNPKALMKLANFDDVEVTDDLDITEESVKKILTEAQKEHAYLFNKQVSNIKDATPGSSIKKLDSGMSLSGLKSDDLKKLLSMKIAKK